MPITSRPRAARAISAQPAMVYHSPANAAGASLQSEQAPDDAWSQLPFAYPDPTTPSDLSDYVMDEIIDKTFTFQRELGATHLIPPYFYSAKRGDAWWLANRAILRRAGDYLRRNNIESPVIPVLAVSLREYGSADSWATGVGDYLATTRELNTETVALSWSWNEPPKTGEAILSLLLSATERAAKTTSVIGWRAGLFGPARVAVRAGGYETGIGSREYLHYTALAGQRKPRVKREDDKQGGGSSAYVYLSAFGRSVKRPVATRLLEPTRIPAASLSSLARVSAQIRAHRTEAA